MNIFICLGLLVVGIGLYVIFSPYARLRLEMEIELWYCLLKEQVKLLPETLRMLFDRNFRKRVQCFRRHKAEITELFVATISADVTNNLSVAHLSMFCNWPADEASALYRKKLERMSEQAVDAIRRFAAYIATLTDDDINILVGSPGRACYGSRTDAPKLKEFLWDERQNATRFPWIMVDHFKRAKEKAGCH